MVWPDIQYLTNSSINSCDYADDTTVRRIPVLPHGIGMGSDSGPRSTACALLAYVRPAFMLPAVGMSIVGGLLSSEFAIATGGTHALAVGLALYVAHLRDGYVDAHLRGEEQPVLSARGNRTATAVASGLFLAAVAGLAGLVGTVAAALTVPLWALAVLHAPYLDTHPFTVTVDYPFGIAVTLAGGYAVQSGGLDAGVVAIASLLSVALSATKVSVDRLDLEFDRSIDKQTVPVLLGDGPATVVSAAAFALAGALVLAFVAAGTLPSSAVAAVPFPVAAGAAGVKAAPERAVRVQMALAYPFLAVLAASRCLAVGCAGLWLFVRAL